MLEHKQKLSGFTAKYNVTRLVWFESTHDIQDAIAFEKRLKGKRREKKVENCTIRINELKSKIKSLNLELIEEKRKIEFDENDIIEIEVYIHSLEKRLKNIKNEMTPAIKVVSQIDKIFFRRRMLSELKQTVPLVNLGISGVKIFT